jgi:endoglucanase
LVRRVGDRLFLLPGLRGFDHGDSITINLSYYAFFAFDELASLDSSPTWRILRDDGLDALDKARFGQWQLPTDWVDVRVARGGEVFSPAREMRFSFDAVRVPLNLVWSGLTNSPAVGSIARYWASFEGQSVPAWINVVKQEVSHFTETAGESAVRELVLKATGTKIPNRNGSAARGQDYYSVSLMLLSRIAEESCVQNSLSDERPI